jgi:hypothetical protein
MLMLLAHRFFGDKGTEGFLIFLRHVSIEKPEKTVEEWVHIIDKTAKDYGMDDMFPFPLYDVSEAICMKEWGTSDEGDIVTFAAKIVGGYEAFFFCFKDALKGSKLAEWEQIKYHVMTEFDEIKDQRYKRLFRQAVEGLPKSE